MICPRSEQRGPCADAECHECMAAQGGVTGLSATEIEIEQLRAQVHGLERQLEDARRRSIAALETAIAHGGVDGAHHKDWVIDQMVRSLAGAEYRDFVARACEGEDGPNTYEWNTGVAP